MKLGKVEGAGEAAKALWGGGFGVRRMKNFDGWEAGEADMID